MKYSLLVALYLICVVLFCACVSPESRQKHDAFLNAYAEANEDGVISTEEQADLSVLFGAYVAQHEEDGGNPGWETLLSAVAGAVTLSLVGVRVTPDKWLASRKATV